MECIVCGKKEEITAPSRIKKYKTCSLKCLGEYNKQKGNKVNCIQCGKQIHVKPSGVTGENCCSYECMGEFRKTKYKGENNPNWMNRGNKNPIYKGGSINIHGYRRLPDKDHPNARKDGTILEHRKLMSDKLNRPLADSEIVHHRDEVKLNNSTNNLQIMSRSEHSKLHVTNRIICRNEKGQFKYK
jgi:hypothetical protein